MQKAILLFVINTEVSKQASKQQIIPHTTKLSKQHTTNENKKTAKL